ncbi:MAG: DNA ligase-associated DEXH box helicase, partial [Pseudomonas sp.]
SVAVLVRYLRELGLDAQGFSTEYGDEEDDAAAKTESAPGPESTGEASS